MKTSSEDVTVKAWKQQIDGAARAVEAIAEGSMRIREAQLKAATAAHARMDTARKQLEKAADVLDLWRIQSDWVSGGWQESFEYWHDINQVAADTQSNVTKYLYEPVSALAPRTPALPEVSKTALGMMDEAYRRWRETTLQFYSAPKATTTHKAKHEA